ncbi:hypothetical protein HMF8227_02953 [Saliniradius amylolyticus]|uniref:Uncharacterized protein n=1 Tax=Saliniradius amylolyticus TaxID=2183582 RepID=A0A2S2E6X6_9ALTE|nr:hypothetical protein [Saliniradius amylolyticus]AWL13401.1 hypothetical protein HMF8227_02953 [Saliniradius amylolyticus]
MRCIHKNSLVIMTLIATLATTFWIQWSGEFDASIHLIAVPLLLILALTLAGLALNSSNE